MPKNHRKPETSFLTSFADVLARSQHGHRPKSLSQLLHRRSVWLPSFLSVLLCISLLAIFTDVNIIAARRDARAEGAPLKVALYRIISNPLPPYTYFPQLLANIEYILKTEPRLPDCDKFWILNRIANPLHAWHINKLMKAYNQTVVHLTFDKRAFSRLPLNIDEFQEEDPFHGEKVPVDVANAVYRDKNVYVVSPNAARNLAFKKGVELGADWILPLDGTSYFTKSAWITLLKRLRSSVDEQYVLIPSVPAEPSSVDPKSSGKSSLPDRPLVQIGFRNDADRLFNVSAQFGSYEASPLLASLGVQGPSDELSRVRRNLEASVRSVVGGTIYKLISGKNQVPESEPSLERKRQVVKKRAILSFLQGVDEAVLKTSFNAKAPVFFQEENLQLQRDVFHGQRKSQSLKLHSQLQVTSFEETVRGLLSLAETIVANPKADVADVVAYDVADVVTADDDMTTELGQADPAVNPVQSTSSHVTSPAAPGSDSDSDSDSSGASRPASSIGDAAATGPLPATNPANPVAGTGSYSPANPVAPLDAERSRAVLDPRDNTNGSPISSAGSSLAGQDPAAGANPVEPHDPLVDPAVAANHVPAPILVANNPSSASPSSSGANPIAGPALPLGTNQDQPLAQPPPPAAAGVLILPVTATTSTSLTSTSPPADAPLLGTPASPPDSAVPSGPASVSVTSPVSVSPNAPPAPAADSGISRPAQGPLVDGPPEGRSDSDPSNLLASDGVMRDVAADRLELEHAERANENQAKNVLRDEIPFENKPPAINAQAQTLPANDAQAEELPANNVQAAELPVNDARAEEVPANDAVAEELVNDAQAEELPANDAQGEELPASDALAEELPANDARREELPANDALAQELPANDAQAEELPALQPFPDQNNSPPIELPAEEMENAPQKDPPAGESESDTLSRIPANNVPPNPAASLPANNVPANDLPAVNLPADHVPPSVIGAVLPAPGHQAPILPAKPGSQLVRQKRVRKVLRPIVISRVRRVSRPIRPKAAVPKPATVPVRSDEGEEDMWHGIRGDDQGNEQVELRYKGRGRQLSWWWSRKEKTEPTEMVYQPAAAAVLTTEETECESQKPFRPFAQKTLVLTLAWYFDRDNQTLARVAVDLVGQWLAEMQSDARTASSSSSTYGCPDPAELVTAWKELPFLLDVFRLLARTPAWSSHMDAWLAGWANRFLDHLMSPPVAAVLRPLKDFRGTWYDLQVASLAAFVDSIRVLRWTVETSRTRLRAQFGPDGLYTAVLEQASESLWNISDTQEQLDHDPDSHLLALSEAVVNLQGWIQLAQLADLIGCNLWKSTLLEPTIHKLDQRFISGPLPYSYSQVFDRNRLLVLAFHSMSRSRGDTWPPRGKYAELTAYDVRPWFDEKAWIMPYWNLGLSVSK